uniref:Uncharacterized protein n=1 Tax=Panagrolaimus sp. PS1159 TaxID=55785 RepID=A0AC35GW84_9BILA
MGVQGLWQILEPTATPVALESLEGKRIAVDISLWLHQALQGFNQYGGETRSPHLVLLINRIAKLLFYKIRPVFVFDGDQIPVFKRHLLRDRELRRFTDQLIVNKQQKRALIEAATQSVGETLKKKARIEDNDIFALPEDIPALPDQQQLSSSSANYKDDKFLAGYHNLISRDEKIAFLAEAKQKVKKTRLNDADIPADADDFSKFQTERLLQRNQLNNEIDMLRSEKAHQTAKVQDKAIKMVVVDAHARSHLLTKDHDSDIEVISPEKKKPTKLPWTEFVKKYKQQYHGKSGGSSSSKKPSTSFASIQKELNSSNEPVNEMIIEESEDDDDDVAETFRSVEEEAARRRDAAADEVFQIGHIPSKTGAIDAFIGKMNALKKKGENFSTAQKYASDDDSDFEDVPILAPKVASTRKLTIEQMTKVKPVEDTVIQIDSENEGDIEFAGRKTDNADLYDREDEKGVYTECQQLLQFLGLPYIVAPGEAEAQCAELERLGLVEGIVTDDSDIWLFGGKNVYKNMFSKKRNVHFYSGNSIEKQLNLTKMECIQLTMLAGGDYTRGFEGVGMVTALEIIAEFSPKIKKNPTEKEAYEVLEAIRKWLDSKREFEAKPNFNRSKPFIESKERIRLRRAIEKNNDEEKIEAFPNKDVYEAYCHPVVDSKDTSFKWKGVEFTALEDFLWTTIGWSLEELHRKTYKAFTIWDEFINRPTQSYQTRISGFVQKLHKSPDEQLLAPTSRVQAALKKLFKTRGINPEDLDKTPISKLKQSPMCVPQAVIVRPHPHAAAVAPKPSLPPPQVEDDDFYDESLDDEVFRLIEEKKKKENDEKQAMAKAAESTSKIKPKLAQKKARKSAATKKPVKLKIPPATLQPSELNLSEDDSSDED